MNHHKQPLQIILNNPDKLAPYYNTWSLMRCPERAEVMPSILGSLDSLRLQVRNTEGIYFLKCVVSCVHCYHHAILPLCALNVHMDHWLTVQPKTAATNSMEASKVQWLEVRGAGITSINGIFKRSGEKAGCAWFEKQSDKGAYEIFRYQTKKSCPQVRDLNS